jgi:hypothetical protein
VSAIGELIHGGSLPLPDDPFELRFRDNAVLRPNGAAINDAWRAAPLEGLSPEHRMPLRMRGLFPDKPDRRVWAWASTLYEGFGFEVSAAVLRMRAFLARLLSRSCERYLRASPKETN